MHSEMADETLQGIQADEDSSWCEHHVMPHQTMKSDKTPKSTRVTDYKHMPQILKRAFAGRENRVSFKESGMRIKDGFQVFGVGGPGAMSAKTFGLGELVHDMCHFVEIDERRMHLPDFGLATYLGPTIKPKTRGFVERELRVLATEYNIFASCGVETQDIKEHIEREIGLVDTIWRMTKYVDSPEGVDLKTWMFERLQSMRNDADKSTTYFMAEWLRRIAIVDELERIPMAMAA